MHDPAGEAGGVGEDHHRGVPSSGQRSSPLRSGIVGCPAQATPRRRITTMSASAPTTGCTSGPDGQTQERILHTGEVECTPVEVESIALVYDDTGGVSLLDAGAVTA